MTKLFNSERDMQDWLRDEMITNQKSLGDLICNSEYLDEFVPSSNTERRILESFRESISVLYVTNVITDNENISLSKGEVLKPDFLLYGAEGESVVIVELKNESNATRQAGTEMSAYSAEVRSYLPFNSDGDIANVIVSSDWPTLLRHHIFHEIFWIKRNVLCLEPIQLEGDQVGLRIKEIPIFADPEAILSLPEQGLGGYQLCLYDDGLYSPDADRTRFDAYVNQMRASGQAMAAKGNAIRCHGFAFLWRDTWSISLAPYSFTIVNVAAFRSLGRFLLRLGSEDQLTEIQRRFLGLVSEYDPVGHGRSLDQIEQFGASFLSSFCKPRTEGFYDWKTLKYDMDGRAELVGFYGWGVFGDTFFERLRQQYLLGNLSAAADCPAIGQQVVAELVDPNAPFVDLSYFGYDPEEEECDDLGNS